MYVTGAPEHAPPPPAATGMPAGDGHRPPGRVARWAVPGGALLAAGALCTYVYAIDPNATTSPYPKCILKQYTGLDCPGCGGTRCVHALLHGDLRSAFDHNALVVLLLPIVAYAIVRWVLRYAGVELPALRLPSWMAWAIPVGMVAFTIVRNIPGTPLYVLNSAA